MIESKAHNKKRTVELPTTDYNVSGLSDLSHLRPGGLIAIREHTNPLTVQFVGIREVATLQASPNQYAIEIAHDRADAGTRKLFESINIADGSVIEIVDIDGRPVRGFGVGQ